MFNHLNAIQSNHLKAFQSNQRVRSGPNNLTSNDNPWEALDSESYYKYIIYTYASL